jgi:hypothetical protein
MAESNCQNCKYHGDRGCAVNPNYWEVQDLLNNRSLSDSQKSAIKSYMPSNCSEWEVDPLEEEMTIEIRLTRKQWVELANAKGMTNPIGRLVQQQAIDDGYGKVERESVASSHIWVEPSSIPRVARTSENSFVQCRVISVDYARLLGLQELHRNASDRP